MGLFPSNYVEVEKKCNPAQPVSRDTAIALYDYLASEDNEISFNAGELIEEIVFVSEDWWQGSLNEQVGLFPSNYVELK